MKIKKKDSWYRTVGVFLVPICTGLAIRFYGLDDSIFKLMLAVLGVIIGIVLARYDQWKV